MRSSVVPVAVLATALLMSGCGDTADGKTEDPKAAEAAAAVIPVEVRKPLRAEMLAIHSGTASLEADEEAAVVSLAGAALRPSGDTARI